MLSEHTISSKAFLNLVQAFHKSLSTVRQAHFFVPCKSLTLPDLGHGNSGYKHSGGAALLRLDGGGIKGISNLLVLQLALTISNANSDGSH